MLCKPSVTCVLVTSTSSLLRFTSLYHPLSCSSLNLKPKKEITASSKAHMAEPATLHITTPLARPPFPSPGDRSQPFPETNTQVELSPASPLRFTFFSHHLTHHLIPPQLIAWFWLSLRWAPWIPEQRDTIDTFRAATFATYQYSVADRSVFLTFLTTTPW